MGKQKYPITAGGVTVAGERKQRNHHKTGKLAKRREVRRLEAIDRQVVNIQRLEKALEKAKDKTEAQKALTQANYTLQTIRGGVPHAELRKRFETPTIQTNETPSKQESAPQSKENRKPSRNRKGGSSPASASI